MNSTNYCNSAITHNDIPILHEIRHALEQLIETGESTTIDLNAIPMAPGEELKIVEMLGEGEISTTLNALGPSTIVETGIGGVWLTTHYNLHDAVLGTYIEIAKIPSLLVTEDEELVNGLQRLKRQLLSE